MVVVMATVTTMYHTRDEEEDMPPQLAKLGDENWSLRRARRVQSRCGTVERAVQDQQQQQRRCSLVVPSQFLFFSL